METKTPNVAKSGKENLTSDSELTKYNRVVMSNWNLNKG